MRSQVDHRPVSGEMRRAELPDGNQFRAGSERLTTPAIRRSTALVAVTAKRPNATSTPTGSTKTDSKSNSERNGGTCHVSQQGDRDRQSGPNPEIRALPSGQNVANFSLATTSGFTDRNGTKQQRTEWHRMVAFGPLADTCDRF